MLFKRRRAVDKKERGTILLLQVPRSNDKKELAAEQLFANLHGLFQNSSTNLVSQRLSFEIAVKGKQIGFYVWTPDSLVSFVEEQIYAQYPSVQISRVSDYSRTKLNAKIQLAAELGLSSSDALPFKTFPTFEVDPLAAITASISQLKEDEEAWIQVVISPAAKSWIKYSERYVRSLRGGTTKATNLVGVIWGSQTREKASPKLTEYQASQASAAEEKGHKLAYNTTVRIIYRGNLEVKQARLRLQAITASFKQFNTTYLNSFSEHYLGSGKRPMELYKDRSFGHHSFTANIEELASLYHLPHTNVETPNILWVSTKATEPPAKLTHINEKTSPEERRELSPIAVTNFRGQSSMFGLPRQDRDRHLYIVGQTGVGKSGLLELLTISDIYSPYGFAVIDPHGDYALSILRRIPEARIKDVIYFNPSDTDFPIAFNPMELSDPKLKTYACSELIGVLKRMFDSWGPRLEYILRYSILALLDYPDSTMLDITRILTDAEFRDEVISYIEDPVVRNFWIVEFSGWSKTAANDAIAPVLNKVGAFTANPIARNIIGQAKSSFNIRQIMDKRKILIVNLSHGLIGEDNASILGALLVTKIQIAAMSRADIPEEERVPFYLYVDEFQNFATESFTTILSEARKYSLILTVANQYIAQMPQSVKDAVFGNVGSVIAFRTSADDAKTMSKYFEPHFSHQDLVNMNNRNFAINMTIGGEKMQAFSATTLGLPDLTGDFSEEIIENSRREFAVKKMEIETIVNEIYESDEVEQSKESLIEFEEFAAINIQPPAKTVDSFLPIPVEDQPREDVLSMQKPIHKKVKKHDPAVLVIHHAPQEFSEDRVISLR